MDNNIKNDNITYATMNYKSIKSQIKNIMKMASFKFGGKRGSNAIGNGNNNNGNPEGGGTYGTGDDSNDQGSGFGQAENNGSGSSSGTSGEVDSGDSSNVEKDEKLSYVSFGISLATFGLAATFATIYFANKNLYINKLFKNLYTKKTPNLNNSKLDNDDFTEGNDARSENSWVQRAYGETVDPTEVDNEEIVEQKRQTGESNYKVNNSNVFSKATGPLISIAKKIKEGARNTLGYFSSGLSHHTSETVDPTEVDNNDHGDFTEGNDARSENSWVQRAYGETEVQNIPEVDNEDNGDFSDDSKDNDDFTEGNDARSENSWVQRAYGETVDPTEVDNEEIVEQKRQTGESNYKVNNSNVFSKAIDSLNSIAKKIKKGAHNTLGYFSSRLSHHTSETVDPTEVDNNDHGDFTEGNDARSENSWVQRAYGETEVQNIPEVDNEDNGDFSDDSKDNDDFTEGNDARSENSWVQRAYGETEVHMNVPEVDNNDNGDFTERNDARSENSWVQRTYGETEVRMNVPEVETEMVSNVVNMESTNKGMQSSRDILLSELPEKFIDVLPKKSITFDSNAEQRNYLSQYENECLIRMIEGYMCERIAKPIFYKNLFVNDKVKRWYIERPWTLENKTREESYIKKLDEITKDIPDELIKNIKEKFIELRKYLVHYNSNYKEKLDLYEEESVKLISIISCYEEVTNNSEQQFKEYSSLSNEEKNQLSEENIQLNLLKNQLDKKRIFEDNTNLISKITSKEFKNYNFNKSSLFEELLKVMIDKGLIVKTSKKKLNANDLANDLSIIQNSYEKKINDISSKLAKQNISSKKAIESKCYAKIHTLNTNFLLKYKFINLVINNLFKEENFNQVNFNLKKIYKRSYDELLNEKLKTKIFKLDHEIIKGFIDNSLNRKLNEIPSDDPLKGKLIKIGNVLNREIDKSINRNEVSNHALKYKINTDEATKILNAAINKEKIDNSNAQTIVNAPIRSKNLGAQKTDGETEVSVIDNKDNGYFSEERNDARSENLGVQRTDGETEVRVQENKNKDISSDTSKLDQIIDEYSKTSSGSNDINLIRNINNAIGSVWGLKQKSEIAEIKKSEIAEISRDKFRNFINNYDHFKFEYDKFKNNLNSLSTEISKRLYDGAIDSETKKIIIDRIDDILFQKEINKTNNFFEELEKDYESIYEKFCDCLQQENILPDGCPKKLTDIHDHVLFLYVLYGLKDKLLAVCAWRDQQKRRQSSVVNPIETKKVNNNFLNVLAKVYKNVVNAPGKLVGATKEVAKHVENVRKKVDNPTKNLNNNELNNNVKIEKIAESNEISKNNEINEMVDNSSKILSISKMGQSCEDNSFIGLNNDLNNSQKDKTPHFTTDNINEIGIENVANKNTHGQGSFDKEVIAAVSSQTLINPDYHVSCPLTNQEQLLLKSNESGVKKSAITTHSFGGVNSEIESNSQFISPYSVSEINVKEKDKVASSPNILSEKRKQSIESNSQFTSPYSVSEINVKEKDKVASSPNILSEKRKQSSDEGNYSFKRLNGLNNSSKNQTLDISINKSEIENVANKNNTHGQGLFDENLKKAVSTKTLNQLDYKLTTHSNSFKNQNKSEAIYGNPSRSSSSSSISIIYGTGSNDQKLIDLGEQQHFGGIEPNLSGSKSLKSKHKKIFLNKMHLK